jgi:hypothetical protein
MKNFIYLFIVGVLTLASCNSNDNDAKSLVSDYMSKSLMDASSYESVEFTELDSTFSIFYFTTEAELLRTKRDLAHARAFELKLDNITENSSDILDSIRVYEQMERESQQLLDEREQHYKGEFDGWTTVHTYRAKNGFGAYRLGKIRFIFNKDVTEIVRTNKIS